jgi:hypothetical protein
VGPSFVLFGHLLVRSFADSVQAQEQLPTKQSLAERAVQAFGVVALVGLALLDVETAMP